jgi:hypothetical protein
MEPSKYTSKSYEQAAITREINIKSLSLTESIMGTSMDETLPMRLRCECGRTGCDVIINVTLEQRRETRSTYPQAFIISRGHLNDTSDKVLINAANFVVIDKDQ